jgi:thiamine pyrophosphokinase
MRAIIIAAGQADDEGWRGWIGDGDWIIAADGGAGRALAWGLKPDLVIGDMDSLTEGDRAKLEALGCRFIEHPRAKDETDLELALGYAARGGAQEIVILGALGGRLDHAVSNLLLLALPDLGGIAVRLADGEREAMLVRSGETVWLEGSPGDLVSLLPLGGDVNGVTTRGLAWGLDEETLFFGFSRGVSNEMVDCRAEIRVGEGILLVVHDGTGAG